MNLPTNNYIEVKAVTWEKDSHGLFDYEFKHTDIRKFSVQDTTYFARIKNDFHYDYIDINEIQNALLDPSYLNCLEKRTTNQNGQETSEFFIHPESNKEKNEKVFLIVRSFKNKDKSQKGIPVKEGDIVKIGRIELLVTEANYGDGVIRQCEAQLEEKLAPHYDQNITDDKDELKQCRICFGNSQEEILEEGNYFISPCDCSGTSKYVHYQCLKLWLHKKIKKQQSHSTQMISWKKLECEVCKKSLPKKMLIGDIQVPLVHIDKPKNPYIILESTSKATKTDEKSLYILEYNEQQDTIKIGRGHQCQARISDISVSRFHSYIKFDSNKKEFKIFDNNSKFGTLMLIKEPYRVTSDKVAVQIGRTVITFVEKFLKNGVTFEQFNSISAQNKKLYIKMMNKQGSQNNLTDKQRNQMLKQISEFQKFSETFKTPAFNKTKKSKSQKELGDVEEQNNNILNNLDNNNIVNNVQNDLVNNLNLQNTMINLPLQNQQQQNQQNELNQQNLVNQQDVVNQNQGEGQEVEENNNNEVEDELDDLYD